MASSPARMPSHPVTGPPPKPFCEQHLLHSAPQTLQKAECPRKATNPRKSQRKSSTCSMTRRSRHGGSVKRSWRKSPRLPASWTRPRPTLSTFSRTRASQRRVKRQPTRRSRAVAFQGSSARKTRIPVSLRARTSPWCLPLGIHHPLRHRIVGTNPTIRSSSSSSRPSSSRISPRDSA